MRTRSPAAVVGTATAALVALMALAAGGCSGSSGASPGGGGAGPDGSRASTPEGGSDGGLDDAATGENDAAGDAPTTTDAPTDGPGGAKLSCTSWKRSTPLVLEDDSADAAGFFGAPLSIVELGGGAVRVIAQPGAGPAFRVFTIDTTLDTSTPLDGPVMAGSTFEKANHVALSASSSVTQVLVQSQPLDGSDALTLDAWLLPDAMAGDGPLPSSIAVSPGGANLAAIPLDASTVFSAVQYLESVTPPDVFYGLGVGVGSSASGEGSLANVSLSPNGDDFDDLALTHAGGTVYVFATNGRSITGESFWAVPDTATVATSPTSTTFDTGVRSQMIDIARVAGGTSATFAYYASAIDSSTSTLRVGSVTDTQLPSLTSSSLTVARTYSGEPLAQALTNGRWSGDDLMLVGPAPADDGGGAGMNAVWLTSDGSVRAEQIADSALLPGDGAIRSAAAASSAVTGTSAAWDVVWVEARGAGEVLLYNELDCQ